MKEALWIAATVAVIALSVYREWRENKAEGVASLIDDTMGALKSLWIGFCVCAIVVIAIVVAVLIYSATGLLGLIFSIVAFFILLGVKK